MYPGVMGGRVLRRFRSALSTAGLPRQPFHALLHAYATLLLEQGEELGVVSRTLGHSYIATTSDVYAHFTRTLSARAAIEWTPYWTEGLGPAWLGGAARVQCAS